MWDLMVVTAGDDNQAQVFRRQLDSLDLTSYCRSVLVFPDPKDAGRIGSGGSMIYLAGELQNQFPTLNQMKALLIHSGGYAQRMSYQSIYGKCFAQLPGAVTFLEKKLQLYEKMSCQLPNGLLVTSSDVLEDVSFEEGVTYGDDEELILFATECDLETASGHGVFVLDRTSNELQCVLQKPSPNEVEENKGELESGNALTDCFYWMSWNLVTKLSSLNGNRQIEQEICCYGDFMRPLGANPKLEYLQEGSDNIRQWRADLFNIFSGVKCKIVNLGVDSFFHLGTHCELIEHISLNSKFLTKIIGSDQNSAIHSNISKQQGPSIVEFTNSPRLSVGRGCIVSGLLSNKTISLPDEVMIFSIALKDQKYATCAVPMGQDVKKKQEKLLWMGIDCGTSISLWNAPIFPARATREESLDALLEQIDCQELSDGDRISLDNVIFQEADVVANLMFREEMKNKT